jgi:hypothetical protein
MHKDSALKALDVPNPVAMSNSAPVIWAHFPAKPVSPAPKKLNELKQKMKLFFSSK